MANFVHLDGFAHLNALPCIRFHYQQYTAVVSLYGGQLLSLTDQGRELLWLSPTSQWQQQQPIRGGVPICWPWFGPVSAEFGLSQAANHGLVRNRMWQAVADESCADHSLLVLQVRLKGAELPWHPAIDDVVLECSYQLDAHGLQLYLHCEEPMLQQAALHTYFACDDVRQVQVSPLPALFNDKVTQTHSDAPLQFGLEMDRIYSGAASGIDITTPALLKLQQSGHDASIVWNPGQQKGSAAAEIGAAQWQKFVCVETARLQLTNPAALKLGLRLARG